MKLENQTEAMQGERADAWQVRAEKAEADLKTEIESAKKAVGNFREILGCQIRKTEALKAEVKRLREIVDRLPKTADGMPVMQGDTLFGVSEIDGRIIRLTADEPTLWAAIEDLPDEGVSDERIWDFCANAYSTREAAEGAKEKA